jgi:hypothetical protein
MAKQPKFHEEARSALLRGINLTASAVKATRAQGPERRHRQEVRLVFLKLFERIYAPLTAGLLRPVVADAQLPQQKLAQLDRLYQRVSAALDRLVHAVGLKAA